jgi:hypothetical protein
MYHNSKNKNETNYRLTNNDGWIQVTRGSKSHTQNNTADNLTKDYRPLGTYGSSYKNHYKEHYKSSTQIKPSYYEKKDYMHKKVEDTNSEIEEKRDYNNYKKTLCKNINNIGKCIYSNKCLFAHNIEEQNVDQIRLIAYNMIKKKDDLSHIDLSKNRHLYNQLSTLSKLCQQCEDKTCTGGYNCKHGACDKIYVICQTDLNKGTCDGNCGKIHLTEKHLVPYGISILQNNKTKITIPTGTIINDEFFKNLKQKIEEINKDQEDIIFGTDNESICSDNSDRMDNIFKLFPISKSDTESLDELNYDELNVREEKLTKSIFKIDIMCI